MTNMTLMVRRKSLYIPQAFLPFRDSLPLSKVNYNFPLKIKLLGLQYNLDTLFSLSSPHSRERKRERSEKRERDEGHIEGDNGGHTGDGGEPRHSLRLNPGAAG